MNSAAGQDRDEQEFAEALELFMEDNDIQNALEAFAQSCSQHSRDLRSVQLSMLAVLPVTTGGSLKVLDSDTLHDSKLCAVQGRRLTKPVSSSKADASAS